MANSRWYKDELQFPRILAEINAVGLSDKQVATISESMDLQPKDVYDLLWRAERKWEMIKRRMVRVHATPAAKSKIVTMRRRKLS